MFRYLFYIFVFLSIIASLIGPFVIDKSYDGEELNKTAIFIVGLIHAYIFSYILL